MSLPSSLKLNMNKWQAVVFDLDDTLFAERDYVFSGFKAVARWTVARLGLQADESYSELKALFDRGVRYDTFDRWLGMRGLPTNGELRDGMVRLYREHEPEIRAFPDAAELLDSLDCKVGLLSDGDLAVQERKFAALGLARYFQAVVFSDGFGREFWKPHCRPFETVLAMLGVAAEDSVYVGDNPAKDFKGARALGMFTVRIRREECEHAQIEPSCAEYAPDLTLTSLSDLARLREGKPTL